MLISPQGKSAAGLNSRPPGAVEYAHAYPLVCQGGAGKFAPRGASGDTKQERRRRRCGNIPVLARKLYLGLDIRILLTTVL
jgi:hypothetical protein